MWSSKHILMEQRFDRPGDWKDWRELKKNILMEQRFDRPGDWKDWRELKNPSYGEIEEVEDELEKSFRLFNNFDVIEDPPLDHRFITNDHRKDIYQTDAMRSIIHREWEILKDTLPGSSVFVRVYRTRPDLMRAAIIGPEGTPYTNGLFFFDVLIPSKYPSRPPEICYLYHGIEINPYLYKNGRVTIELLNWGFWNKLLLHRNQKWSPEKSSVLQVLTSIEKSVLKGDPDSSHKPVVVELCKSMLDMLQHPPMGFKVLVEGHFRKRSHSILMMYKAIMKSEDHRKEQLFWNLIKAFEANGSYCGHHYSKSQQVEYNKTSSGRNHDQGLHEGPCDELIYGRRLPSRAMSIDWLFHYD